MRGQDPREIVVAVPIGARATCAELAVRGGRLGAPGRRRDFRAVGQGYLDFGQTTDEEVQRLLAAH